MASVNVAELRASLKSCIEFCREHPQRSYCERQLPLLERALEKFEDSRAESDKYYAEWRAEWRAEKQAWKQLSATFADVQRTLDRVNATGYPDKTVRYWDPEALAEVVEEMIGFLQERADKFDFADDEAGKLERYLEAARAATEQQEDAYRVYNRRVKKRSSGRGLAVEAVRDFRELLRDELGKDDADYQSIRWPYAISPDEGVL